MVKVKILRNYGAVAEGDIREVSLKQLDFLIANGIAEKIDCSKECEECEDCKSTKKKRAQKDPVKKVAVKKEEAPKKTTRRRTTKK
jgi:hypothetical protein